MNFFKTVLLLFLFSCFNQLIFAQDLNDKFAEEMCNCIASENIKSPDKIQPCYDKLFENNKEAIKKQYKVAELSELNIEEFSGKIAARLIDKCTYIHQNFPNGGLEEEKRVHKDPNVRCSDLKEGKYYYLMQRPNSSIIDTTFVTLSDGMYLERMTYKNTFSLLKITWKDSCKFELEFQKSNDPLKKEMSKRGQVYKYEVMANKKKSIFINTYWKNKVFQFELIKLK